MVLAQSRCGGGRAQNRCEVWWGKQERGETLGSKAERAHRWQPCPPILPPCSLRPEGDFRLAAGDASRLRCPWPRAVRAGF